MKLEKISVHNYIATREVELKPKAPVTLICGNNEAGKSSLCEAIKHAFTGQSTRVSLKKDFKFLVNDDKKDNIGYALIEYNGGKQACITIPNGAHEIKEQFHSALPYVLDPELFSSLSENDRRRFVLGLSPESNSTDSVKEKLLKKGCEAVKVDEIIPFLTSGFDAAHKEALNKSREAKSAWRETTGENYGHQKADIWVAPKAEIDPTLEEGTRGELLGELKSNRKAIQEKLSKITEGIRLNKEADEKTTKAKQFHKEAQEWDQIAGFLAPDGIPGDRLNIVLKLINDRLKISSVATGWGTVIITNDMTITCNTRRYSLLSVSAKWRVNAMIAEAISHVTGIKFLILDGFDVLSPQGRGQLIKWVYDLAIDHEIDTLIMLATLKALPTGLHSSISCHWIENGFIA